MRARLTRQGALWEGLCYTHEDVRKTVREPFAAKLKDIPRALALLYLLRPQNFTDSQLNIPESGNGIPDILDEAYWGVKHLLMAQQADGGVGTWIETTGHPGGDHGGPAEDSRQHNYAISLPTHDSCYDYIGAAALVARAFKAAGDTKTADELLASSLKAWEWTEKHGPVEKYMEQSSSRLV